MLILILLLILYLFHCSSPDYSTAIVLTSCVNPGAYAWHQTAMPMQTCILSPKMRKENREKVPEKSIFIMHFINNHIKLLYVYFANL